MWRKDGRGQCPFRGKIPGHVSVLAPELQRFPPRAVSVSKVHRLGVAGIFITSLRGESACHPKGPSITRLGLHVQRPRSSKSQ